jgi:hypothetical protein
MDKSSVTDESNGPDCVISRQPLHGPEIDEWIVQTVTLALVKRVENVRKYLDQKEHKAEHNNCRMRGPEPDLQVLNPTVSC